MGKYFTRIEESGWAAYIDESKTNAALYPFGVGNTEVEAVERLENSILVLEDIAAANDYIKLADDEIVVKLRSAHDPERARRKDMCHIEIDALAKSAGYVKLEPGQVVVNESTHSLAMHMAAKWAEHVAENDRGVTFIRTSNMEARDE